MSVPRRITVLAALLSATAVLLAPIAALASEAPDGSGGPIPAPVPPPVVTYSSPAWMFVVVGLGAAVITAAALFAVEHYRHRHTAPSPA